MKQDKVIGEVKKLTRQVAAFTGLVKACGGCVKELSAMALGIYGLIELMKHWTK